MRYKKIMILAMLLVSLLAISAVSASENATGNSVSAEDTTNVIDLNDNSANVNDVENEKVTNDQEILKSTDSKDTISLDSNDNVLSESSPRYYQYSVNVYDTTINYGSSGAISMSITPCTYSNYYAYDFYLKVYDSNNNVKINKNYYSTSSAYSKTYVVGSNELSPGTYTIKIVNYEDSSVMDTATLTVKSSSGYSTTYPPYSAYSVSVYDTTINYGSSGTISMSISPASSSYRYKYDFNLKIYDSNNNLKISKNYYSTSSRYSETYTLGSNQLSAGTYTIKIVNDIDNKVMDTAKLTIKSSSGYTYTNPTYTAYSVSVYDTTINYGSSGTISMSISPASSYYKYKYNYYMKVYDSNNNLKINYNFYSTSSDYSRTYSIGSNQLSAGTYTIKIVNYYDNKVMDTAKLTIKSSSGYTYTYPSYTAYSVSVYDTTINYGSSGTISMSISPASSNYNYKYDYYLKVYDSNNNLKINQEYYSTSSAYSKTYSLGSNQLSAGTYTIKIVNYADNNVMDTAKLTVKSPTVKTSKIATKVSAPKVTAKKGESKAFKITIKNKANNKAVKNVKISVKVGSKTYTLKTKSNGVASLNTKSLSVGTHKIIIKSKNSKYKISAKSTIVIKKAAKTTSNYKIITTTAKEYWITKNSGVFTVKTIIWDMTAGFRAPYKYIDTTLYKNGNQMINTKYLVNYKIDGVWTGWVNYGTESTAHHRYSVEDSASVDQIKVRVHK